MSGIKFTTNERVDQFADGQQFIEIIGYVDEIGPVEHVGYDSKLKKFLINNGTGRKVPCTVWDNQINKITTNLETNKIIHLRFLMAKKRYEKHTKMGNVNIELNCGPKSTIRILGDYEPPAEELDNTTIQKTESQQETPEKDIEATCP